MGKRLPNLPYGIFGNPRADRLTLGCNLSCSVVQGKEAEIEDLVTDSAEVRVQMDGVTDMAPYTPGGGMVLSTACTDAVENVVPDSIDISKESNVKESIAGSGGASCQEVD